MGDTLNAVLKLCNWWGLFKNYILLLILLIIIIVIGVIHSKINKITGTVKKIAYCTYTEEVVRRRSKGRTLPPQIKKKYTCRLIVEFTLNGVNHLGVIEQGAKTNYKVGDNINIDYKHVTPTQNTYADIIDGLRRFCEDYGREQDMCSEHILNNEIAPNLADECGANLCGATGGVCNVCDACCNQAHLSTQRECNDCVDNKCDAPAGVCTTESGPVSRPDPENIDTYIEEYIKLIPVYTRFCEPPLIDFEDTDDRRDCIPETVNGEIQDSTEYLIKFINKRLNDKGIEISLTWPRKLILIVCSIILIWTILWTYLRHFHADKSFMKFFIGLTCWKSFTSSIRGD